MFYQVRLLAHDSTVLASCEEQTLKDAKSAARDYMRDPEYFTAEPHKAEVLTPTDLCVFDVFARPAPPIDVSRKRELERLALFAAQHSFPVRIAYAQDCITVGIDWTNAQAGTRGIEWHAARTLKQLRDVLGY